MQRLNDRDILLDAALGAGLNGDFERAKQILLSMPTNDPRAVFNLGWYKMRDGDLHGGLENLNAGRFINCFGSRRIEGKIWAGEDLNGKVLLLRSEGGFGDQVINFRFANEFKELGANVVVSCDPQLSSLFSRHGFICVDNIAAEKVYYDFWVPSMSAAYTLKHTYETLSGKPYIKANPKKLYSKRDTIKVGVRWSGNPEFEHEQHRRFDPSLMVDLHNISGTTFYSLQRDENLVHGLPFSDLKDEMKTWDDTAEIIAGLDLVITSCTSIAHLSAAMGVETWVVVPVLPYYTWVLPGEKSPWYDAVRLFRQEVYGDWTAPFERVREELIKKTGGL